MPQATKLLPSMYNIFILKYKTLSIIILVITSINGHVVGDKAYLTELKKLCEHAYNCYHDTILICGKSVHEARTFLDLCDMYEYACELNMVFRHVKDEEGVCPDPRHLQG